MARILGLVGLWVVLAAILAMIVGGHAIDYYRLSEHGIATVGTAVAKKPHDQIEYVFEMDHRTHKGIGRQSLSGPGNQETQIGDKLAVYYLPEAPDVSCLGHPHDLFSNEIVSVILVVLLFPTMIILALIVRRSLRVVR